MTGVAADIIAKGYKHTEVGVIPDDWEAVEIGQLARFASGQGIAIAPLQQKSSTVSVPVYGGNGIAGYTDKPLVTEPTIVIGRVGQKCGEVQITDGPSWITDNALYPRVYLRDVDRPFLALAMATAGLNKSKNRNDLPLLTQTIVHSIRLAFPSRKAEQATLAGVLAEAGQLIASLEKVIEKKRAIKQGIMRNLLTGNRRLAGFHQDWVPGVLGDVVDKIVGGGTPSRSNATFWGGGLPWATVKDLTSPDPRKTQDSITKKGLRHSSSSMILKGTLIVSVRMALGRAIVYDIDVCINQDLKALYFKKSVSSRFMYYWFQFHQAEIDALGGGSTVKGISISQLSALQLRLPALEEQTAIAEILCEIDREIGVLEDRMRKMRSIQQGMKKSLLTGKIRLLTD